jgi:hypothetical protein
MCSSTVATVAPQKQRHAADLWDSPCASAERPAHDSQKAGPAPVQGSGLEKDRLRAHIRIIGDRVS